MPAKNTSRVTPRQKAAIARGKAAGKTNRQVASDTGLSHSTVDHLTRSPEIVQLRDAIERRHAASLDALYSAALASCEKDLGDKDAIVRHDARTQAMAIVAATDRGPAPGAQPPAASGFTLQQLVAVIGGGQ